MSAKMSLSFGISVLALGISSAPGGGGGGGNPFSLGGGGGGGNIATTSDMSLSSTSSVSMHAKSLGSHPTSALLSSIIKVKLPVREIVPPSPSS